MIITYAANGGVTIKSKDVTVAVWNGVTIGAYPIVTAGEYEISGIQCDVLHLPKADSFMLHMEDLTVTCLSDIDTAIIKQDNASNTDVLIVELRSDANIDELKSIVKALEPSYLVLSGAGSTSELVGKLGIAPLEGSQLKVTHTSLPLEGTQVLSPA